PPRIAPHQAVIVPIFKNDDEKGQVMPIVEGLKKVLKTAGIRVHVDTREGMTPGFKFNDWEMRGVQLRIEIGPKHVQNNAVAIARRDVLGKAGKQFVPREGVSAVVDKLLTEIQASMLEQATKFRDVNIYEVTGDYAKFKEIVAEAWAYTWFCGSAECEAKIKEDNQAVSRCFPLDQEKGEGPCIACGTVATERPPFAKAYCPPYPPTPFPHAGGGKGAICSMKT